MPACFVFGNIMTERKTPSEKGKAAAMMAIVAVGVIAMTVIDLILQPPYAVKSAAKVALFTGMPLAYSLLVNREVDLRTLFKVGGGARGIVEAVLLGAAVFGVIVGAYLLIGGLFDFSQITANMEKTMGIT